MSLSIFNNAKNKAIEFGHAYLTPEHVMSALLDNDEIKEMVASLNVDVEPIQEALNEYLSSDTDQNGIAKISEDGKMQYTRAVERMHRHEILVSTVAGGELSENYYPFLSLYSDPESFVYYILLKFGIVKDDVEKYIKRYYAEKFFGGKQPSEKTQSRPGETELDKYAVNLNEEARKLKIDPLIGREKEVYTISQIMARYKKNNAMLIGEAGVGKTAIVEGLALQIVNGNVPDALKDCTIYALDIAALLAGTRFRGEFEERVKQVLDEIKDREDIILFIDEIHMILSAGGSGENNVNAANLLKPALARGDLRCIGSTTYEEYRKHVEKDKALARRFKTIDVLEPSPEDAKAILEGSKSYYEKFHGLTFGEGALEAAVDLTVRYVKGYLPDKAFDLIDDAGSRIKLAGEKTVVELIDIENEVSKTARIPTASVSENEVDKLDNLDVMLKAHIFGQDEAIDELVTSLIISRSGLREPNKPAATYLAVGPTGVGKTELAKKLAEVLNIDFLRYDMSEYMEKHSVSKLIGAGPGYVGYGEGGAGSGELINDIDTHPYCVLLIDEIEKASKDVLNIFLGIMDNASLKSSTGKRVSFENVILIMTSNAGSALSDKQNIGFTGGGVGDYATDQEKEIKNAFTPEFRNRLDGIIRFKPLDKSNMVSIATKFISEMNTQALNTKGVVIEVAPEVIDFLAIKGFDPLYGARPMKRAVTEYVKKPLARLLLKAKSGTSIKVFMLDGVPVVE